MGLGSISSVLPYLHGVEKCILWDCCGGSLLLSGISGGDYTVVSLGAACILQRNAKGGIAFEGLTLSVEKCAS